MLARLLARRPAAVGAAARGASALAARTSPYVQLPPLTLRMPRRHCSAPTPSTSPATSADADFESGLELLDSGKLGDAVERFASAASRGDPGANFFLGLAYDGLIGRTADGGHPIETDAAAAARCYTRAAEAGHAEAMLNLSLCYRHGEGVEAPDVQAAWRWLRAAAAAGSERAQFNAALALDPLHPPYGTPGESAPERAMVPKDPSAAVDFYSQAVEQKHPKAMVNLGIALYTGSGCDKDTAAAKALWETAAEAGVEEARTCLRNMESSPGAFEKMLE